MKVRILRSLICFGILSGMYACSQMIAQLYNVHLSWLSFFMGMLTGMIAILVDCILAVTIKSSRRRIKP